MTKRTFAPRKGSSFMKLGLEVDQQADSLQLSTTCG